MASNRRSCDQPPTVAEERPRSSGEPDLGDYQRAWDEELGGNPTWVLVGIGIALLVFVSIGVLPWALSYMQDNGIIRPRVNWQEHTVPALRVRHAFQQRDSATGDFGSPRRQ